MAISNAIKSSLHGTIGGILNLAATRLIDVHGRREIPLLKSHSSSRSVKKLARGLYENIMPGSFHQSLSVEAPESGLIANSISVAH
jgi:hypothetical protein